MENNSISFHDEPQIIIEPEQRWYKIDLKDLWDFHELIYFLIWRDFKARYRQTAIGVIWVVLQPIISMIIFTVIFSRFLGVSSGDIPYPVFAYAALLPWNFFANSLSRSSLSIVNNASLVTKIYFPRLIIPISSVLSNLIDFFFSFLMFLIIMAIFRMEITWQIILLPLYLLLAMSTAMAFGIWFSALNVRYRDVIYIIPFIVQIWMYVTPVVFSISVVPEKYRFFIALNPMTAVVEGFRRVLLGSQVVETQTSALILVSSIIITLCVLISGWFFFQKTEQYFADII